MAQSLGNLLVNIQADTTQLIQGFNRAETAVNKTTKTMSYAVKGLIGAFVGLNTLDLAKNFTKQMDMITEANNKLLLATKNTQEFTTAQKELFRVAQATNQGFSETVDLYSNLALSMGEMGKSQAEVIRTVETVNKAIAISGSNAQQSAAAVLQLGQAFGSGKLGGDELSSLTENSKGLVRAIAEGMGVAVGQLKELGSQGKITSEVLYQALAKMAGDVDEKFGNTNKSVSQGFNNLTNSVSVLAGQFGNAIGFGDGFANTLFKISNYLDTNKDDIINYGIVTTATISKVVDNFMLLGAEIKNVAELPLDSVGIMAFGALKSVSSVLLEITKGLNKINLSSDKSLSNAQALLDFANKGYTNFKQSAVSNIQDIDNAYLKANVSIEDRIKLMEKEYKFQSEKPKNTPLVDTSKKEIEKVKEVTQAKKQSLDEQSKYELEILDQLDKEYQAKIENRNDLIAQAAQLIADPIDTINNKYMEMYNVIDGVFNEEQMQNFFAKWQEEIDKLAETMPEFDFDIKADASGFEGVSKALVNVSNSFKDINKNSKAWEEYNKNLPKDKKNTEAYAKAQDKYLDNQIDGYSNLAGAISGMFEDGSKGAKAFQAIQASLLVTKNALILAEQYHTTTMAAGEAVKATSIATDAAKTVSGAAATIATTGSTAPFPLTIPAITAVIGILAPIMALVGKGTGGGGSAPSAGSGLNFGANISLIEDMYTPMTNRLDRQIELLESIDKNGSASQLGIEKAVLSFEKDYKILVEETFQNARLGFVSSAFNKTVADSINNVLEQAIGVDVFKFNESGTKVSINYDVLREGYNLLDTLIYYSNNPTAYTGPLFQQEALDAGYKWSEPEQMRAFIQAQINATLDEFQGLISDWTMGLLDSMDDLKSAKDDFKGYFDDITGTMTYANKDLAKAFTDIAIITKGSSLTDYLAENIDLIINLENFLTDENINLLLSSKPEYVKAQMALLDELGIITNQTFENGAREALDYIDSIELVAEAMATSTNNIKDFIGSLKTDESLLYDMANNLGVNVAYSIEDLGKLFNQLANDAYGLTDADLELLNANKNYIQQLLEQQNQSHIDQLEAEKELNQAKLDESNKTLAEIKSNITTVKDVINSLNKTIETLRSTALEDTSYTLDLFNQSMNETLGLLQTQDYEKIAESINKTIGYSSALTNESNFALSRDMKYAQLVAAKQFEDMDITLNDELDYLKMIEENTANTVDALTATLTALGQQISNSINDSASKFDDFAKSLEDASTSSTSKLVSEIYTKYDLNKYQKDSSGYAYWENQISSGKLSVQDAEKTIVSAAKKWIEENIPGFAVGTTNVPFDQIAQIHQGEMITPKSYTDGIKSGDILVGDTSRIADGLSNILESIDSKINSLVSIANNQLLSIIETKDLTNESLSTLQNIEVVI